MFRAGFRLLLPADLRPQCIVRRQVSRSPCPVRMDESRHEMVRMKKTIEILFKFLASATTH